MAVDEQGQGVDLNGDGDLRDPGVIHVLDLRRREVINLQRTVFVDWSDLAVGHCGGSPLIGLSVSESADGRDYDGNGEIEGDVMHAYHMELGGPFNLGIRTWIDQTPVVLGERLLFAAKEPEGTDWNGDGDDDDTVPMILQRRR